MTEKQQIEKITAEKFLKVYNKEFNTSFVVKELSDSPDVICEDSVGHQLKLEITLTEDHDGDIKALLGRSEHKNLEYVKQHGMGPVSSLPGNVSEQVANKILKKMSTDYGNNVALVVRDVSPIGWDWNPIIKNLKAQLVDTKNLFDKGIWIFTSSQQDKIFRVL